MIFCWLSFGVLMVNSFNFDEIFVSFQPEGYYLPTGWIEDIGHEYSMKSIHELHTNIMFNITYGWNVELHNKTWEYDVPELSFQSKYVETGLLMDSCDSIDFNLDNCNIWRIQIPNGWYNIRIGVGHPNDTSYAYKVISQDLTVIDRVHSNDSNWLMIGEGTVEVTDNHLTVKQLPVSFGCSIDYIAIERIKCGNITLESPLDMHAVYNINYTMYYPSLVQMNCKPGYQGQQVDYICNIDGTWDWSDNALECNDVKCGDLDDSQFNKYHAFIYWKKYDLYQSRVNIHCISKEVNYYDELICTTSGEWKWINGSMKKRCPAWIPKQNHNMSLFTQYFEWFLPAIILGLIGLYFVIRFLLLKYLKL